MARFHKEHLIRKGCILFFFIFFLVFLNLINISCVSAQAGFDAWTPETTPEPPSAASGNQSYSSAADERNNNGQPSIAKQIITLDAGGLMARGLLRVVNEVLYAIWVIVGIFLEIAGLIFNTFTSPVLLNEIFAWSAITTGWIAVRDSMNLFFILVILFSAFCTIFQIEKYNLKKVLLTVVIMALLVNFSYPIARFIIDISNITMYFFFSFFQAPAGSTGLSTSLAQGSNIQEVIFPGLTHASVSSDVSLTYKLMGSIIFLAIFTITLLMLSILFLVRTVVLVILIIFSPVGFALKILPGKLSSFADSWWDNLMKYAFFGPIMAFMLYISLLLMRSHNLAISGNGTNGVVANLILAGMKIAVPVTVLWVGMMVAQKMGAYGSAAAYKFGSGAVKKFSGANFAKRTYGAYQARRKESDAHSVSKRLGTMLGSKQDQLRSKIPGKQGQYAALRYQRDQMQKVEEAGKLNNVKGQNEADLHNLVNNSRDKNVQAAAAQELADRGVATGAELTKVGAAFNTTSQVFQQLANKVRSYNPTAAFSHITNDVERQQRMTDFVNSNQFDYKKLKADAFNPTAGGSEFAEIAIGQGAISPKNIAELQKRGTVFNGNIERSLDAAVSSGRYNNAADESHRNMQAAYFANTGDIQDASFAGHIFSTMDEDTANRMSRHTVNAHRSEIENNIKQGRIKNVVYGMRDNDAAKDLVRNLKTSGPHQSYVNGHPDLSNFA